jgi:hypothetical protein
MAQFRRGRLEEQLDEELRAHIEMSAEENLRRGMLPEEARCAARREFGGMEQAKEAYRDQSCLVGRFRNTYISDHPHPHLA